MARLANTSFCRGAFAATAIAGLAVSSLFASQSAAQTAPTPATYEGTAACAKVARNSPTLDRAVQCEARELERRIAAARQRGMAADRRGADADRRGAEADRRGAEADRRTAEAIQRGVEADRRAAASERATDCIHFLTDGVQKALFTKEAVLSKVNGKLSVTNACDAARNFGYAQKAELSHPSVQ